VEHKPIKNFKNTFSSSKPFSMIREFRISSKTYKMEIVLKYRYVPIVYYISNEYNRNAYLTVDRCGLLVSIYVTIPLLDAALPLKSITKNEVFWRESI